VANKAHGVLANLENGGMPAVIHRKYLRVARQDWPVAHVAHQRKPFREEAIEGVIPDTSRLANPEFQWRCLDPAAGSQSQDLCAQPDANHGQISGKKGACQRDLFVQRWQVAGAGGAPGPAAQQDQAVAAFP
jgi:hypothetical protein